MGEWKEAPQRSTQRVMSVLLVVRIVSQDELDSLKHRRLTWGKNQDSVSAGSINQINNLNRCITPSEIELVIKSLTTKNHPGPYEFIEEF